MIDKVEEVLKEYTASKYVPDFREPHTWEDAHHRCRDMAEEIVRLRSKLSNKLGDVGKEDVPNPPNRQSKKEN